jgi:hypothetical protein
LRDRNISRAAVIVRPHGHDRGPPLRVEFYRTAQQFCDDRAEVTRRA